MPVAELDKSYRETPDDVSFHYVFMKHQKVLLK